LKHIEPREKEKGGRKRGSVGTGGTRPGNDRQWNNDLGRGPGVKVIQDRGADEIGQKGCEREGEKS